MSNDAEKPNWDKRLRDELARLTRDHGAVSPQVTDFLKRLGMAMGDEGDKNPFATLAPETMRTITKLYKDNLYTLTTTQSLEAHTIPARNMLRKMDYTKDFYERALIQGAAGLTICHVMRVDDKAWEEMGRRGRIVHLNKMATALNSFMIHEGHIEHDPFRDANEIVIQEDASQRVEETGGITQAEFSPDSGQIRFGANDDHDSTADQMASYNSLLHEMTHRLATQTITKPYINGNFENTNKAVLYNGAVSATAHDMMNVFRINAKDIKDGTTQNNAYHVYRAQPEERIAHFIGDSVTEESLRGVPSEHLMTVRDVLATSDVPHVEVVEKCTAALRALSKPSAPKPKI